MLPAFVLVAGTQGTQDVTTLPVNLVPPGSRESLCRCTALPEKNLVAANVCSAAIEATLQIGFHRAVSAVEDTVPLAKIPGAQANDVTHSWKGSLRQMDLTGASRRRTIVVVHHPMHRLWNV
jgi:hypothetical protein